jgi:hypothetical protein
MDVAKGSIRQRGSSSYELRVYAGTVLALESVAG